MKTLKLVGLETWISPITKFTAIRKGNVVTVSDFHAARMLQGSELIQGAMRPHWEVVSDHTQVDFHLCDEIPADQVAVTEPVKRTVQPVLTAVPEPIEKTADEIALADKIAEAQKEEAPKAEAKAQRVARKAPAETKSPEVA